MGNEGQARAGRQQPLPPRGAHGSLRKIAAGLQPGASQAEDFTSLPGELTDGCTPDQLRALADEVHAAASVIDPARQLVATVAKISAARETK